MQTFELEGKEYIELNKLLKILRWVNSGGEANMFIDSSEVLVNNEIELRRRRKLRTGDFISFMNKEVKIID